MKILDRYILKAFLTTFLFTVLVFVTVTSLIDFTENHDDFIQHRVPYSEIFGVYYLNYFPFIANMLSPILIFVATVIVTAQLAARTEIIAMFNSGMSLLRILRPYVIGSAMVAAATFALIGWIIPKANDARIGFEKKYMGGEEFYEPQNVHMKIEPGTYLYMKSYSNISKMGFDFTLETIRDNKLFSKLKANKIAWNEEKGKWSLTDYSERKFDSDTTETFFRGTVTDTVLKVKPFDFQLNENLHQMLTLPELNAYIKMQKERGAENIMTFLTEKYERYTYPFAIIILTVIAVIVSARKSRQGTGFQIAFGFVLAMIYILFVIMSRSIAQVGTLSPLAAAWTPNIVFSIIGVVMYNTLPR